MNSLPWRIPKRVRFPGLAGGIFVIALATRLIGLSHADNLWDEHFYYDAARLFLKNLAAHDFSPASWRVNFEHPPLGKYVYFPAIAYNKLRYGDRVPDGNAYDAGRVTAAVLGALTATTVFVLGRRLFPISTAFLGAVIYTLLPPVLGYDRVLGLDALLVFLTTLATYFLVRGIKEKSNRNFLWAGLIGAAAFATKFNGLLILFTLFGGYLLFHFPEWRKTGRVTLPLTLLVAPLLFPVVLVLSWPWLWSNSVGHFAETLVHWGGAVSEVWFGKEQEAPVYYFLFQFLVSVPGLTLLAAAVSAWLAWRTRTKERFFLLLAFLVPFFISPFHLRQDSIRYVLPAYPAFALLAADGFSFFLSRLRQYTHQVMLTSLLLIYLAVTVVALHPYYLDYFNELIGFPKTVAEKGWFELGFYGEGIREATEYVNRVAYPEATVRFEIIPDNNPFLDRTEKKLVRHDEADAEYLIVNARAKRVKGTVVNTDVYREIYSVKVMGAPFVWVYQKENR